MSATAEQLASLLAAARRPVALDAPPQISWPEVARLACSEGVAGLLLEALDTGPPAPRPPDRIVEQLRHERYQGLAANTLMRREAAGLLDALAESDIPVLLLKGAALQETLYPRLDLRRMGDIDLLVAPSHVPTAIAALQELGYSRCSPELWPGSDLRFENESVFQRRTPTRVLIELHWNLIDSPHYQSRIDQSFFWEGAEPVNVAGATGLAMRAEALLLYLCIHLELHHARDEAPHVRWLHDVWALLERDGDDIDWPSLLQTAEAFGLRIPFARALERVCEAPWRASVPAEVRRALQRGPSSPAESRAYERSLRDYLPAMRLWNDLAGMQGSSQRLRFLLYNLFPSPAYMRSRYATRGPGQLVLAYPKRWLIGLSQLARGG